jgi:hypothetical protein
MPDDEAKLGSAEKVDESTSKRKLISDDLQPSRIKKKKAPAISLVQSRSGASLDVDAGLEAEDGTDVNASAPCYSSEVNDDSPITSPRPDADQVRARASMPRISLGRLAVTPSWLSPLLVDRLRSDAVALKAAGAFTAAAVGGSTAGRGDPRAQAVRKTTRRCEACGLFDDAINKARAGTGDPKARQLLFEALADLRLGLEESTFRHGRPLADAMELQYLCYPGSSQSSSSSSNLGRGAGFYGRHVDQQVGVGRAVSLLVYLNSDRASDGGPWQSNRDGGQLVAYPGSKAKPLPPERVDPSGGTLVLFDSRTVEHEALPTRRKRWALVGWFLEPQGKGKSSNGRQGQQQSQRSSGGGRSSHHNKGKKLKKAGKMRK